MSRTCPITVFEEKINSLDEEAKNRASIKIYKIRVNDALYYIDAQSLGQALRQAGNLRLNETDVVVVKLDE